ncbi:hypothetical protein D6833_06480 [Candidatus Parcubacteria bacterium]|nr:MAG: hypothetical protein D6833_06480 [Candidatus Parcubacteria bacterium]
MKKAIRFFLGCVVFLAFVWSGMLMAWTGICGQDHSGCDNLGEFVSSKFCVQRYSCDGIQGEERCQCDPEIIW